MRKLTVVLVAAMLLTAGNIFANDSKVKEVPKKTLSTQISELLKNNNFNENHQGCVAKVLFTLNNDKEIVVLSVDTEEKILKSFITSKLNYQEVELDNFEAGKNYTVSVRINI